MLPLAVTLRGHAGAWAGAMEDGAVGRWTCPECGRQFGRNHQSHDCAPALSLAEYFATGPAHERPIFDAVMAHVRTLGPVYVEPVSVGIFLKRGGKFAELRPKVKWVALWFAVHRPIEHPKIARTIRGSSTRTHHVINLRTPDDVDDDVRAWLTEAYFDASE
jgi:hypothetical protein